MTVGYSSATCASCKRRLPRAAARCPWCQWRVGILLAADVRAPPASRHNAPEIASSITLASQAQKEVDNDTETGGCPEIAHHHHQ